MARLPAIAQTAQRNAIPSQVFAPERASSADFGGAIGAAVSEAGQAVGQFGAAVKELELIKQRDAKQLSEFNRRKAFIDFSAGEATTLAEAAQSAAEGNDGAFGFQADFVLGHAARAQEWLDANGADLDPADRAQWEGRLSELRSGFSQDALRTEFGERKRHYTVATNEALDQLQSNIDTNPDGFDGYYAQGLETINATGLSAADKQERTLAWKNEAAVSYARARGERDPAALAEELGATLPTLTEAGDYTGSGAEGPAREGFNFFRNQGLTGVQAAGVVGVLSWESGGLNPNGRNPGDGRDGSDSVGLAQWNGERAAALKAFAAAKGKPWNDRQTQFEFVMHEMKTTEPEAYRRLRAATTIEQAVAAMNYYERPAGHRPGGDPSAVIHWRQRVERATQVAGTRAEETVETGGFNPNRAPGLVERGNIDIYNRPTVRNGDGSISTVRSMSIEEDGRHILIPTVAADGSRILSDDEAVAQYEATGQQLGVFDSETSATAYAERLHDQQEKQYSAGADPRLAGLTYEQRVTLRAGAVRAVEAQARAADQARAAEQAAKVNALELSLLDGTAGKEDIEAARNAGWLDDATDVGRLTGIVEKKAEDNRDLDLFNSAINTPGFVWNPFSDEQKKAANAAVEAAGNTPEAALQVWQRTGILPEAGAVAIRGGLVSTDPQRIQVSANIASNMLARNPNAFAGVQGGSEMEVAATRFSSLLELGIAPADAAAQVAKDNDPRNRERIRVGQPEQQAFRTELVKTDRSGRVLDLVAGGGLGRMFQSVRFIAPEQRSAVNQDYADAAAYAYSQNGDERAAHRYAEQRVKALYGVSNGTLVKFPPQNNYPAVGGSHDYIYSQASQAIRAVTGREIDPSKVYLMPLPTVTAQAWRAGRPAPYQIHYVDEVDGQRVYRVLNGRAFQADPRQPAAAHSAEQQRLLRARQQRRDTQRAAPSRSLPGIPGTGGAVF